MNKITTDESDADLMRALPKCKNCGTPIPAEVLGKALATFAWEGNKKKYGQDISKEMSRRASKRVYKKRKKLSTDPPIASDSIV